MPKIAQRHTLAVFQPVLDLLGATVTADNYIDLAVSHFPKALKEFLFAEVCGAVETPAAGDVVSLRGRMLGVFPRELESIDIRCGKDHEHDMGCFHSAIRKGYVLGGRGISRQGVLELRARLAALLDARGGLTGGPVGLPPTRRDFVVGGRVPLTGTDDEMVGGLGEAVPLTGDLQDHWYQMIFSLIHNLRDPRPRVVRPQGKRVSLPFRPLRRCPGCNKIFFRAGGPRQTTCGKRRCIYLWRTARRARGRSENHPASN